MWGGEFSAKLIIEIYYKAQIVYYQNGGPHMKNHPIRRALSVVLSLVFVLELIPVITPTVFATMHYHGPEFNGDSVTLYYSCNTCGADY